MIDVDELPQLFTTFIDRWSDRNERMSIMLHAVNGEWAETGPDDEDLENRSPNVLQVALEDTAEAASLVPTVRVSPSGSSQAARRAAEEMERMAIGYMDASQVELLTIRTLFDLVAYGLHTWIVTPDEETGGPLIQWRDPSTCFPEPGWKTMDSPREVMFARTLFVTQLPPEYRAKVLARWPDALQTSLAVHREKEVILVEYFTEEETVVAALYQEGFQRPGARLTYTPIELDRWENPHKICPVVIGQRITLDNEPRGQFDQIVGLMRAHIRLMSMVLDYADQAVYCLTPETRVLTENLEYVEVGKLEVGDNLVGFDEFPVDGQYRRWRRAEVTHTGRRMIPSYRVVMEDGTEFTASSEHKWLVKPSPESRVSEWVPTWKLDGLVHSSKGAHIVKPLDFWEHDKSWESGYLAGVFDGEGCLSKNGTALRLQVAQRDNECLKLTEDCLAHFGFDYSKTPGGGTNGDVFTLHILGGVREIVRFLMTIRPERLITKFLAMGGAEVMGRFKRHQAVKVASCDFVDMVEVVTLATSTGTLVAEGYAHHNSDVWVKDLIGPLNFGGGSYIQLGPQGQIGRVQPAVSDLAVFRELDSLIESMHLGGRWPKVRPGEVDQSIASAKFIEASAGMMNTVIRTLHLIMKASWERALRVAFVVDRSGPRHRTVSGVLRNQQFMLERDSERIDLKAKIRVEYGIGLGRDPAQSMVLGIQAANAGLVSTEFVQENFEGITDLALERTRLDVQKFHDMALARILQGLETGGIPEEALIEMARARANGQDVFDIFDKFVIKPRQEAEAQMLTSGIDGAQMMPGPGPEQMGGGAPMPPPPGVEQLLGALGGGGPAGPEGGPDTRSRLNVPMGGGSFVSSNT